MVTRSYHRNENLSTFEKNRFENAKIMHWKEFVLNWLKLSRATFLLHNGLDA